MAEGPFEARYNEIMDEVESKLKTDSRMLAITPRINVVRGAPTEPPIRFPELYLSEGRVKDIVWDSHNALMTITFAIEVFIKSPNREQGVREIRTKCLKIFDTLVGEISDRRLDKDGVSLADGEGGLQVIDCDFGYFAPPDADSNDRAIIYKGVLEVEVNAEVQLNL